MIDPQNRKFPELCRLLLRGERKLAVWGATSELTMHEWQRQIPGDFLVDTQWGWWSWARFHGMEVCSPSRIETLDPRHTVISNNYAHSVSITEKIDEYLGRIGGHATLEPMGLQSLVRTSLGSAAHRKLAREKSFLDRVDEQLGSWLIRPSDLAKERELPLLREMEALLGGYEGRDYLDHALRRWREMAIAHYKPRRGHVCLMIGSLDYGGAERQICNLAVGLKRSGWNATMRLFYETQGLTRYAQFLKDEGISCQVMVRPTGRQPDENIADIETLAPELQKIFWHMNGRSAHQVLEAYHEICVLRPELVITYLDSNNVIGGLAAALAGVPHVLLSGRNVAPTQIAHLFDQVSLRSFAELYPLVLPQRNIVFTNNSTGGAVSYAHWLGGNGDNISVIPNCVNEDFAQRFSETQIATKRRELGLKKNEKLVLGVFRLAREKRPHDFIRVIAKARKYDSTIRAVMCGQGPERLAAEKLIRRLRLEGVVTLLGVVNDIPLMMQAADFLLHTAEVEGSPNVVLEAQVSGLPIIAAQNSGTQQYLAPEWMPHSHKPGRIVAMAESLAILLGSRRKAKSIALKIRQRALRETSVERLAQNSLAACGLGLKRDRK